MAAFKVRPLPPLSERDIERFWKYVSRGGGEQCWPWIGGKTHNGYARFTVGNRDFRASRISYFLSSGKDPHPLLACHKCDNRLCVRADHIFLGDHAANGIDASVKGRLASGDRHHWHLHPERCTPAPGLKGERNPGAKLTEQEVRDIRSLHTLEASPFKDLGKQFGISPAAVRYIVTRKTWKHVA